MREFANSVIRECEDSWIRGFVDLWICGFVNVKTAEIQKNRLRNKLFISDFSYLKYSKKTTNNHLQVQQLFKNY